MKRFAWVGGGILGALGIPMVLFFLYDQCLLLFDPASARATCGTGLGFESFIDSSSVNFEMVSGALLGILSVMWLSGERAFWLRAVSALSGGIVGGLYVLHMGARCFVALDNNGISGLLLARMVTFIPLVLWALSLLFFSVVVRGRSQRELVSGSDVSLNPLEKAV